MTPRLWALVGGLALVLGAGAAYTAHQREVGRWQERARVADSTARALAQRVARVDTVYRRDTVRLRQQLTRWDTVTREVAALPDTVLVPVEVVRWVAREADSTVQACRVVVLTCEQRVAVRDSLISAQRQQLRAALAQRPSRLRPWLERAAWVALVAAVARQ